MSADRRQLSAQGLQDGRFPGSVRPDQGKDLAGMKIYIHIADNSIKQKLDCEYKYNRNKQSAKYDQCILEVESDRLNKMKILEQSANHCFNDETDPEVIDAVMKKYREAPNIKASTGDLMQEDQDIKDVPQMVAPKKNTKDADKKTAPQK